MKKAIALVLCSILFTLFLTSCAATVTDIYDKWDGSIATGFANGDGTESKPFEIKTCAQLAYLADQANQGTVYTEKYFSIKNNLDLNNLDWTPIGIGHYSFEGIIDGNGHTIKNLKIISDHTYERDLAPHIPMVKRFVAGLFGICGDSVIKNLNIDGANIQIYNKSDITLGCVGVLCGANYTDVATTISDIKITNSKIITEFNPDFAAIDLRMGGLSGYLRAEENSNIIVNQVECDVSIEIEKGYGKNTDIGGLFGGFHVKSACAIENCASYLSIKIDKNQCYLNRNNFGAIGMAQASRMPFLMRNVFSKVTINKIYDDFHGYPAYTAYAIIGDAYCFAIGYQFENVFGCVEQVDESTNEKKISTELYKLPNGPDFAQINCQGCESIPEDHGFDKNIWNLNDFSHPKLK